jgi:hypothetical protein
MQSFALFLQNSGEALFLPSTVEFIEQMLELFHLFLLLQDDGHDYGLKRPWARYHNAGLNVDLGV